LQLLNRAANSLDRPSRSAKAKDIALRRAADAIDLGEVTVDLIYFPRSRRHKQRGRATIEDSRKSVRLKRLSLRSSSRS
jgi:hypothetical protein